MGLEAASFIPELVITNPAGADPVSQGDDHLRLLKNAILGSFPGFVGTTGTPKFVTLTEDEINALIDAALKGDAASISGLWDFITVPTINSNAIYTKVESQADDLTLQNVLQRPTERLISGDDAPLQTDQGNIIRYNGGGGHTLTLGTLLEDTAITVKNVGNGILNLAEGGPNFITWLDGDQGKAGPRTIVKGSIIEMHWETADNIELWGNGIA